MKTPTPTADSVTPVRSEGSRGAGRALCCPVTLSPCHLVTLSLLLLSGCGLPGKPKRADRPVAEDRILDFKVLYGRNCAGCHGAEGKLGPAPPLNDPLFRAAISEQELTTTISDGRRSGAGA